MRIKVGYSWVYVEAGYGNKLKLRFVSPDGYNDSVEASIEVDSEEWEKLKRVGDLVNEQVKAQAELERELNG